ncbi:MAG: hypothetical protein KDI19_00325 [Pseudomonadales bacterium]|nr:hypothetical protein [Pseudomonadales bacterium]
MKRIAILGSSCAGKTTLSKRLEEKLGYKRLELDAINWLAGWQERDFDEFRNIVDRETEAETWITDGNYGSRLGSMLVDRADTIIWINLPFLTVYRRLMQRQYRRLFLNEELWNGNREGWRQALFEKDSLIYWIPRTWRRRNRVLRRLFDRPPPGKQMLEFRSVLELERWIGQVQPHPL